MGWNDRQPTDPYLPPDDYYRNGEEEYHAWLEYVELSRRETGLTSQNIDPANLQPEPIKEAPERRGILSRFWAIVFGHKGSKVENQEKQPSNREENAEIPF